MGISEDLIQLREGGMLDHEMQTWTVAEYNAYDRVGWPDDVWRLESGGDVRFLEHERDGWDRFRLLRPARMSEVMVADYHGHTQKPFLTAVREDDAPSTIVYEGDEYVLAEEDARSGTGTEPPRAGDLKRSRDDAVLMGICGGIAEHMQWPSSYVRIGAVALLLGSNFFIPCFSMGLVVAAYGLLGFSIPKAAESTTDDDRLSHHWVYDKNGTFIVLECVGRNDWSAYVGREVEPYEFDNLLPRKSSD